MTQDRSAHLWVIPAAVGLAGLAVGPVLSTLWLSLHHRVPVFRIDEWVGLSNYAHLASNPRFLRSLGLTAYFTAVSVALELALGLGLALALWREFRGRSAAMAVALVPWIVPNAVSAKMWEWIFNAKFGVLNHLLAAAGLVERPVVWLGTPGLALHAAIVADAWKTAPFMALLLLAGLRSIPADLFRAAQIDGAGIVQTFLRVTLPGLRPMMLVAVLFRSLDAFRCFDVVWVLTGGGPANTTELLSIYAYKTMFTTLDFGLGSAISFVIFLGAAAISAVFLALLRER